MPSFHQNVSPPFPPRQCTSPRNQRRQRRVHIDVTILKEQHLAASTGTWLSRASKIASGSGARLFHLHGACLRHGTVQVKQTMISTNRQTPSAVQPTSDPLSAFQAISQRLDTRPSRRCPPHPPQSCAPATSHVTRQPVVWSGSQSRGLWASCVPRQPVV